MVLGGQGRETISETDVKQEEDVGGATVTSESCSVDVSAGEGGGFAPGYRFGQGENSTGCDRVLSQARAGTLPRAGAGGRAGAAADGRAGAAAAEPQDLELLHLLLHLQEGAAEDANKVEESDG